MIKNFGDFILRNRMNASLSAVAFALVPFLGWMSLVIMLMVTLRKGIFEGLLILLWASLPAIAKLIDGQWLPFLVTVICGGLVAYLIALFFRRQQSWEKVLYLCAGFGVLGVLLMHVFVANPHEWWLQQAMSYVNQGEQLMNDSNVSQQQIQDALRPIMQFATGVQAVMLLVSVLAELLIACSILNVVDGRKNITTSLRNIRLHKIAVAILVVAALLAIVSLLFRDMLPVILLPFFFAGISLIHGLATQKKISSFWLIGFYVLLVVAAFFFPPLLGLVAVLAAVDSFLNFRARSVRVK